MFSLSALFSAVGLSGDQHFPPGKRKSGAAPPAGPGRSSLRQLRQELLDELDQLREELQPMIRELGEEIREQLAVVSEELQPVIQEVRHGIGNELADLREELQPGIEQIRQRLAPGIESFEKRIQPHQERLGETVSARLTAIDEKFQEFVQQRIDPLLGNTHRSQLQTDLNGGALTLRPEERLANRRLGLGLSALSLAVVSHLALAPLMPLAIAIGMYASIAKYPHAVRQWKETGKIGAIHLICVYSLFLWLGGYATAGALGAVLYGLMLKAKAVSENQSRNNLVSLFQLQPDKVWIRDVDVEIEIPFDQLKVGDVLVAHAGQIIPVDGKVIDGAATVDQQMLTGEAQPVEKEPGDDVLASTLVISGRVDVIVEKTSAETTAGQIAAILNRAAQNSKPITVSAVAAADKLALPTLGLSLVSLPFIGPAGAVSLMGANTTTASYLSGSLAILNFLNLAARRRILVKEPGALEKLSSVDTIVFDKTGTLTVEQPHVAFIHRLAGLDEDQILTFAAAAEARQSHPIARAIMTAAAERKLELPAIDDAHYDVGYGLRVRLTRAHQSTTTPLIRVGSRRYMAMEGLTVPESVDALNATSQQAGHSMVMVAVDDQLVGCLELRPTVRPEAQVVIEGLRQRGLSLYIISGDQDAPTSRLASDLGMTGYFANVLPEGKAALVEELQSGGRRVCFIGDGINDAIAMRQADVSISLRGATTVATDTAQIVLMEGNLEQLTQLFGIATEFERNLSLNIRYTSGISVVAVSGILFAGFTFYATEIFYSAALMGGLGIALKPLLDHRADEQPGGQMPE